MRFEAVVFDYFGTLQVSITDEDYRRQRGEVAAAMGADPGAFAAAVRASFDARARGATGDLPTTLRDLARSVGADPSPAQVAAAVALRLASEHANASRIRDGAVETLEALAAQGIRRGLLSDCSQELVADWDDLPLAPLFDAAVLSWSVRMRKPEPGMYAEVCGRLGLDPADCLYVGDGGSHELAGAARMGLTPLRLRAPDHAGHAPYDPDPTTCDEITDLRQVLAWV